MGHIKEPKGVDFIIQSKPLTDQERKQISRFIQDYKLRNTNKKSKAKSRNSLSKERTLA